MSLSLNLESIILLLFFITPGFVFTRTYIAYRPRYYHPADTFEQFVLAIIGSTIIHASIFAVIAVVLLGFWASGVSFINLNTVFVPNLPLSSYPLPILISVIFANIIYLALSLVLARRLATFLGHRTSPELPRWWSRLVGEDPPEPFLLWHTMLLVEPLRLNLIPPHLAIQMRNGEYFEGDLSNMRLVGDEENTVEMALRNVCHRPPVPVEKSKAGSPALQPLPGQVVMLRSTDILWLSRNDIPR